MCVYIYTPYTWPQAYRTKRLKNYFFSRIVFLYLTFECNKTGIMRLTGWWDEIFFQIIPHEIDWFVTWIHFIQVHDVCSTTSNNYKSLYKNKNLIIFICRRIPVYNHDDKSLHRHHWQTLTYELYKGTIISTLFKYVTTYLFICIGSNIYSAISK